MAKWRCPLSQEALPLFFEGGTKGGGVRQSRGEAMAEETSSWDRAGVGTGVSQG